MVVEQPAHPAPTPQPPTQPPTADPLLQTFETVEQPTFTFVYSNNEVASRGGGSERGQGSNTEKMHERQNRGKVIT